MFCSVQCILKFALPAAISGAGFLHTARNCLSKAYIFYHILTQKSIIYFIITQFTVLNRLLRHKNKAPSGKSLKEPFDNLKSAGTVSDIY